MTTEIAVVAIKDDRKGDVSRVVSALKPVITSMPGFQHWEQFVSDGEKFLLTDIIAWDSRELAMAASEKVMATPEGQAYGDLMEKIVVFTHADRSLKERA